MTVKRSAGKWILAQPEDVIEDDDFISIPKVARHIPFGYMADPEDANQLLPIPRELRALEKAKQHLKQYSYREVANWLASQTGRAITHTGLKKRVESEQSNKRRSSTLRHWAKRYETAISKAEEIEKARLGARKSRVRSAEYSSETEST